MIQAMKKRLFVILTIVFWSLQSAFGQIIYTEEDAGLNPRSGIKSDQLGVMVPMQGVDADQWKLAPLGNGIMLLAGLGGAYLLGKKRKKE